MSKNLYLLLQGPSNFSPSKISSLHLELNQINNNNFEALSFVEFYALTLDKEFSDHSKLLELLNAQEQSESPQFLVGPR